MLGTFPIALCPRCHQTPKEEVGINVGSSRSKNHTEVQVLIFQNKEKQFALDFCFSVKMYPRFWLSITFYKFTAKMPAYTTAILTVISLYMCLHMTDYFLLETMQKWSTRASFLMRETIQRWSTHTCFSLAPLICLYLTLIIIFIFIRFDVLTASDLHRDFC